MAEFARKHHYIPEFYLAGFTPSGSKDDFLWIVDHEEGRLWQAKPAEVAHQRDFYLIDAPGVEPDAIEKAFGLFEGEAASVVKKIIDARSLPRGDEFVVLMNLVALIAVRVPGMRSMLSRPLEQASKMIMDLILETPERWNTTVEGMRKKGIEIKNETTYEKMKQFINSGGSVLSG